MNPIAKLQLQKDRKDLATLSLEVERLLRKAGDLSEKINDMSECGYLFVSGLDLENLTIYLIGTPHLLTEMLIEAGQRNAVLADVLVAVGDALS